MTAKHQVTWNSSESERTLKMLAAATPFVFFALVVAPALGQEKQQATSPDRGVWTKEDPKAFCKNDPRPEINAFCQDLSDLQTQVNEDRASGTQDLTPTSSKFTGSLNKLDLANRRAVDDFITATATTFATNAAISGALRDAGHARPDRQLSATSNASGTTSLVAKPGSAELLSLALDTGVLTRSVNGTTTTLTANADQVFRLVTGSDPDCTVTCKRLGWFEDKVLNPTNISANFDLAQQSSKTTATSGQASGTSPTQVSQVAIPTGVRRLSSIAARFEVSNRFDPRSEKFKTAWKKQVTSLKANVAVIGDDTDAVVKALATRKLFSASEAEEETLYQPVRSQWVKAAVQDSSGRELVKAFEAAWNQVVTKDLLHDANLASAVSKAVQDRAVYRQAWLAALDQAVGNLLTFEYDYNRPLNQPITHDAKLIYGHNFQSTGMVTFNGAVSLYGGAIPAAAKYGRVHYGQVSAEYDRTVSGKDKAVQTQLSLAGYWQYQPSPSILNIPAGTVVPGTTIPLPNGTQEFVGTAGSLWVTQFKLTIKGAGGINIPIGVSWSNKTDLLQGSKVGAQIGISYNFSSLAGLFSGGSQ
jgi:hypothetical protein